VWAPAVERSGLPAGLRFHDLRHSYATWLVSDGVPINVVSRLKGHEQISTTSTGKPTTRGTTPTCGAGRSSPGWLLTIC
jgi:integrase